MLGQFLRTMAEAGKIVHTDKEFVYKVMGKYLAPTDRKVLDAAYNGEVKVLENNLELNVEGLAIDLGRSLACRSACEKDQERRISSIGVFWMK